MKTIIEFRDGHSETTEDAAPAPDVEQGDVILVDATNGVVSDAIPLATIKRIVFELQ